MIVAYDLDGVIAESPPLREKSWGHMNGNERLAYRQMLIAHYKKAKVLYTPPETKFHIITARKLEMKYITETWLNENFPEKKFSLHMLDVSRTIDNVVLFKSRVLSNINATCFIEDNKKVVKKLRRELPGIEIKLFPQEVIKEV